MKKEGWHTRGYLPHFDGNVIQFITIRLHDSLPQNVLEKLKNEKEAVKLEHYYSEEQLQKIDQYLDTGIGECVLNKPEIASMVAAALVYYTNVRYELFGWVIMPNHLHFLIRPKLEFSLSEIVRDLKGYTARSANKLLRRSGAFWHPDYFDRFIRDSEHFRRTVEYIEMNPIQAGLVKSPEEWRFSSAFKVDDK